MHFIRPRRPTLRDVAQRAEVSPTTASFVLTGRDDMRISDDARHRVLRAAAELSYRPNLTARSLRTKVTRTIALVSDTIATGQYAGGMIDGSLSAALAHEHLLFVGESEGDPEVETRLIEDLLGRQVDGFVYASMYTRQVQVPRALADHPLVLLNCTTAGRRTCPRCCRTRSAPAGPRPRCCSTAATGTASTSSASRTSTSSPPGSGWPASRRRCPPPATALAGVLDCGWWPEPAYEAVSALLAARAGCRRRWSA